MNIKSLLETVSLDHRISSHPTLIISVIVYITVVAGGLGWSLRNTPEIFDNNLLLFILPYFLLSFLLGLFVSTWDVVAFYSAFSAILFILITIVVEGQTKLEDFLSSKSLLLIAALVVNSTALGLFTFYIKRQFSDKVNLYEYSQLGWGFWLQWIFHSSVGQMIGWIVAWATALFIFGDNYNSSTEVRVLFLAMIGAITGVSLGIMQWLLLQRRILGASWWIPASIAGMMLGSVIGSNVNLSLEEPIKWYFGGIIYGAITGAFIGGMQWLVLKQQFSQSKWWLLASIVGWTVGMAVKRGIFAILPPHMTVIDFFLSGAMGGIMASVMTGGLLLWLLNREVSEEEAG